HDPIALREEAVAADVDAIAAILDRARDAAHLAAHLEHDRRDVGALEQLVRGRETGRAGADDHRALGHQRPPRRWARAGTPATTASAATSRVTTAPAPTVARSPTVTPQRMTAPEPMAAPWQIRV